MNRVTQNELDYCKMQAEFHMMAAELLSEELEGLVTDRKAWKVCVRRVKKHRRMVRRYIHKIEKITKVYERYIRMAEETR